MLPLGRRKDNAVIAAFLVLKVILDRLWGLAALKSGNVGGFGRVRANERLHARPAGACC